jgi:hypothetical protein
MIMIMMMMIMKMIMIMMIMKGRKQTFHVLDNRLMEDKFKPDMIAIAVL